MLAVRLRQPKHLTPPKPHQRRCLGKLDPAIRQIVQHAHPVDLRPAHRNHDHRPNAPQLKLRRVTSLSRPAVTSLSGVYSIWRLRAEIRIMKCHDASITDAKQAFSRSASGLERILTTSISVVMHLIVQLRAQRSYSAIIRALHVSSLIIAPIRSMRIRATALLEDMLIVRCDTTTERRQDGVGSMIGIAPNSPALIS
jgi:hypothetical protein